MKMSHAFIIPVAFWIFVSFMIIFWHFQLARQNIDAKNEVSQLQKKRAVVLAERKLLTEQFSQTAAYVAWQDHDFYHLVDFMQCIFILSRYSIQFLKFSYSAKTWHITALFNDMTQYVQALKWIKQNKFRSKQFSIKCIEQKNNGYFQVEMEINVS